MNHEDWNNTDLRTLGIILAGDAIEECDERGNPIEDETILMLLNANEEFSFTLSPLSVRRILEVNP